MINNIKNKTEAVEKAQKTLSDVPLEKSLHSTAMRCVQAAILQIQEQV